MRTASTIGGPAGDTLAARLDNLGRAIDRAARDPRL